MDLLQGKRKYWKWGSHVFQKMNLKRTITKILSLAGTRLLTK